MKFIETKLKGVYIIEPERLENKRGLFARGFLSNVRVLSSGMCQGCEMG